ncbi:hypothetical protein GIB67_043121 [Kingdonia uniflora]|uniref:FAD-binding domain-containing protein n=1 Tax=Kingdonia uniflora TaxID=39325 RepID=A0A7J7NJT7_9MAGN|nr:hypothetical protein GIB67_043121 [Kingdonia uniflora]
MRGLGCLPKRWVHPVVTRDNRIVEKKSKSLWNDLEKASAKHNSITFNCNSWKTHCVFEGGEEDFKVLAFTSVEVSKDVDAIKVEELIGSLQTFEMKIDPQQKHKGIALKESKGINAASDCPIGARSLNMRIPNLLRLILIKNQATDKEKRNWALSRDEYFNFRAAHWVILHEMLYRALPPNIIMWSHHFLSFSISNDKSSVTAKAKNLQTDEITEIVGDLLIAADGCMSAIRQRFLPDLKLRYSGYCAWRGVIDFLDNENCDTLINLHNSYPELRRCIYFDLGVGTHSVFYELKNKRINWIWYINQPEPELKANSMTMKVSSAMIQKMHEDAEKVWVPALAKVMKETKEPFINMIYDMDPLEQLYFDNVVLVGDAAHPTTPHGLRSTNMSILDAEVLGKCLKQWGGNNLSLALKQFQSARLPIVSKQVLHSRRMGRIKQGLALPDRRTFCPKTATPEECQELQQRNMPFFSDTAAVLVNPT